MTGLVKDDLAAINRHIETQMRSDVALIRTIGSYLIEAGVSSIRIDVRALGNKVEGEPADRVDRVFANGESK